MYPSTLLLVIGDSRWRYHYLALAHLFGGGALLLAALPAFIQWSGLAGLVVSLFFYTRPRPPLRLRCQADGNLQIITNDQNLDEWQTVEVKGSSCVLPGCVLLRFTLAQERHCRKLLILSDSMPETDFRRLRIWLRWRTRIGAVVPVQ